MNAQGFRTNQMYDIVAPSGNIKRPPAGSCWKYIRATFEALEREGRIYFGKDGDAQPSIVRYLDEVEGLVPWTWWPHEETGHTDEAKREIQELFPGIPTFETPKPERLLERILTIASRPGDVVLDCFVGSGTTAAVAHKMGRRWLAIEREIQTFDTYAAPRLRKVVAGGDSGGVTDLAGWTTGGGFRVLEVASSMFEADDGLVVLADCMTNGKLAEATAAQLGYEYQPDPPFAGRKGRTRLAVIDGVVNEAVVRLLVSALDPDERVVVCGTGIDPEARPVLRDMRKGSTLRKIPAALLDRYRTPAKRASTGGANARAYGTTD